MATNTQQDMEFLRFLEWIDENPPPAPTELFQDSLDSLDSLAPQASLDSQATLAPQAPQAQPQKPTIWRELRSLGIKVAAISILSMLIFTLFYGFHRNIDPCMTPMIKDGDLIMFYRLDKSYAIGDLLLLDIQDERQVRRVVAREGDIVDVTEDGLLVNGSLQQEPDIYQQTLPYEDGVSFPLTVEEGQVFVLGDARENAKDSRVYGPVDTKDTLGAVITVIRRRHL